MRRWAIKAMVGMLLLAASPSAHAYTDAELIDGFNKTVFGSEYGGLLANTILAQPYVRKFPGPVRFYVRSEVGLAQKARVQKFIARLKPLIAGLRVQLVARERQANFVVHVVPRNRYEQTVRNRVYKGEQATVRGLCMVRSIFSPRGISRSEAVIVADQGANLFNRCMTEEILQGLGPLNDDRSLKASMFNDTTRFTSFRRFDRIILNMLYDRRIKIGAQQSDVQRLLPSVVRRVRWRIEGRK